MAANSVVGPAAEVTKHLEGRRPYATLQPTPVHSNIQKRSSAWQARSCHPSQACCPRLCAGRHMQRGATRLTKTRACAGVNTNGAVSRASPYLLLKLPRK
jgi:hypothetical protein